jgi:hypothetical protein
MLTRIPAATDADPAYQLAGDPWHDFIVPVVMVIAIIALVAVVVVVATGRGGELSVERNDYAPLALGPVSATDVALLRPPTGVWGYSMQATDEAFEQIAEAIRERDVRIVALEQLVTDLSRDHALMAPLASPYASPYAGARHRRTVADTMPDAVPHATFDEVTTESVRLPFDLPKPGADSSGPPPEQSHD